MGDFLISIAYIQPPMGDYLISVTYIQPPMGDFLTCVRTYTTEIASSPLNIASMFKKTFLLSIDISVVDILMEVDQSLSTTY